MKLTPYQSTFYHEWILHPSRSDYNIIFDQSMSGHLNIQRLNESLVRFVNNNLLVNSNVVNESGDLFWRHRPLLSKDAQILNFIAQEPSDEEVLKIALQPCDLEKELLAKFYAIKQNNGDHRIIYIIPHILLDGLSIDQMCEELSLYYNDPNYKNRFDLTEQKQLHEKLSESLDATLHHHGTEMKNFWSDYMQGVENIDLNFLKGGKSSHFKPNDSNIPSISEFRFTFSDLVFEKLKQLNQSFQLTPYTFGKLVFAIILHRITGIDDLAISYPIGIKEGKDFIFGSHVNTILKVYRFTADTKLEDIINENIAHLQESKVNKAKYLPIGDLIRYTPGLNVFELAFIQTNLKDGAIQYEGINHCTINKELNVDLVGKLLFEQEIKNEQLNYRIKFKNDELDQELVFNFANMYKRVFIEVLEDLLKGNSDKLITQYELLTQDTHDVIVNAWNSIGLNDQSIKTLHKLFEEQVVRTPEAIALVYKDVKLTYKELNERSNRLANYLIKTHGLQPDDLVPLYLDRSENMLIAILGVLKSGAAYVPMDPSYPANRIEHIIQDTGAKVVLAEENTIEKLNQLSVEPVSLNGLRFCEVLKQQESTNPSTETNPTHLAYVIYTSGTTGLPKGVMVEHKSVVSVLDKVREAYGFSEGERITAFTSYVFDVSVSEFFNTLLYGNELHLLDEVTKRDAEAISKYLLINEIAYAYLPPVILSVLPRVDYPLLKGLLYAGEPCDYETGKYWSENKIVYNLYGPTEATIYATYKKIDRGDVHLIGRPVENSSAYVLDASHRLLPVGAVGELYLGGTGIARGYLNLPELTRERFIDNPFQTNEQKEKGENGRLYRTGDLVRWLSDGNIEYFGRNDFQVKIRGYRIELGEIENRLSQFPKVKQSVVLAKENAAGMKYLAGYYVAEEKIEAEKLTDYLSEALPEYMLPGAFVHLTALPLTINGKLDRNQLPEPEFTENRKYTGPENDQQQKLCRIYGEILGLDPSAIGIHDDFFRLGGNSIMAIKLISKIKQELGIQVNITMVFAHKTVESLSDVLDEDKLSEEALLHAVKVSSPEEQRLSFAQERLWFIESYEGGSSAYNIPMIFKLRRQLSLDLLQNVFEKLMQRHEVLRSIILTTEEGVGYQVVTDQKLHIHCIHANSREELEQVTDQAAGKIFSLNEELPIHVNVIQWEDQYYLSVVIHHIAFDGWSTEVFIKEFNTIYQALEEGRNIELPEQAFQYKDFALWQRDYLSGEILDQQILYWKSKLEGSHTLDLPLDCKRPTHISYAGATTYFEVPSVLASDLKKLSKDLEISLYSIMLSGYYLMLSAYSGQDDIVVGSPVANRHHAGLENMIGFFVNTLALREQIHPEQDIKDFILQVSQSVTEAQSHQDLPFEKLVEGLGVEQDTSRHPVFQVMFGIQSFEAEIHSKNDKAILLPFDGDIDYKSAKFDLTMIIDDHGEKVRGIFNYAVSLFSFETILRMKETYLLILKQFVEIGVSKNTKINTLRFLEEEDYKKITENWNQNESSYPEGFTIHQLFENRVTKSPDATALVYQNTRLSYNELNERANRLANYLIRKYHLQPDDLVPLCLDRSENMLIAILAVLKAGAAYVPMDPSYPAERISHILNDTNAKIVITGETLIDDISQENVDIISLNDLSFRTILEKEDSHDPTTTVTSNNLAYVIYTSGTTGMPKGVMIEHKNVVNVISQIRVAYGFSEGEKITAYTSYVFDVSVSEFFNALLYGNELHLLEESIKKDADSISHYLLKHNIAYTYLPPVMLSVLPRIEYPALKGILYAGEPCDFETGKYWSEYTSLYNLYGPTEATIYATYKKVEHGDVHLIGRPIGNTSAYVLDSSHRPVPVGAMGELYLGGNGIARGYLNQPELTAERFIANPFQSAIQGMRGINSKLYKTGDLVRLLPDGNIEYIGRNDFQVKIRGYRIELGEIENKLQQHIAIQQAVVLAKENKAGMKFLVGYYVSDTTISEENLSAFLAKVVPDYMIPAVFVQLENIPLTINGKLDRKALPEPEFTGIREYTAPQNTLQEKLCHIYSEVVGLDSGTISIHDDFFRLGGNSIMAIKLISKIKNILDRHIQVSTVFTYKTIASLSTFLETGYKDDQNIVIEPIEVSSVEEQRLSFAQERIWFIEAYEGGSNAYNIPMLFNLDENVQLDVLQKSLETVIIRHEVLRSVIKTTEQGVGYQIVSELVPEFKMVEVNTKEELYNAISACAHKVFRLEEELPLEITLLKLNDLHYLSVVVHHIAFDGWSIDILLKEVQTVYDALIKNERHQLPELKIQYKDFALWQRNYLTGEILDQQITYWKDLLNDFEALNLPLDFKRPATISYEGAAIYFSLSDEVASGLRKISRDLGVSLYSVMLGGYYLMLSGYSGQEDIILGSPISNRHHAGLEDIIGFFVNTLALRGNIRPEQNLKDFIFQISESLAEAQSHQDLPFEKLVEELGVEQDTSRHPVFQVMFGVQSFGRESNAGSLFSLFDGETDYQAAKFDLTTMIDDGGDTIKGMFNYAVSLFSEDTILRMKDTYVLMLEQMAAISIEKYKSFKISEFNLLKETDQQKIAEDWNNTVSEYSSDKTIHRLFEEQAAKTPDRIAMVYDDTKLSYKELNERSNRFAHYLIRTYDIQSDEIIPVCLERSENMLIALLGVLKSGAAYVPIDPSYPSDRIKHILHDTQAKLAIGQESTKGKLEGLNTDIISLDEVYCKAQLELTDSNNPKTATGPENLAYVIYTSGTTGIPKGVMVEHKGVSNLIAQFAINLDLVFGESTPKNCLWYSNYVFDAHVAELYPVITQGHCIYLLDKEKQTDIVELQQYISENKIYTATIPPVLLTRDYILPLKKLIVAGDITNPQLMALYQSEGVDVINAYGPSEGTVCSTFHYYKDDNNPLNIGGPIGNMTSYVLDGQLRPVPVGGIGELYIGGAGIARGYLNRPELTAERFIANPFQTLEEKRKGENIRLYKTGDLVRWLSYGELEYMGRNDFQVKIRGYRIELGEIENTLLGYHGVRQAVVLAKENKSGLKYLAGYYVSDQEIDSNLLSDYISDSLPEYMIPGVFVHMKTLPLTINGKLDRKQLPEPEFTGNKNYTAPETGLQTRLCQIYADVLGIQVESIGIHDDFFRLGGDSIISIQLVGRIRQQLNTRVSVKDVFAARTAASLSILIEEKEQSEASEIVSEQGVLEGNVPLLPVQEWFFSEKESTNLIDFNHWNQAFLIHVPKLDKELLEESIQYLIERHDALRFRYEKNDEIYIQTYGNTSNISKIKYLNASGLDKDGLSTIFTEWQSGFDIEKGSLYQIGYIDGYEDGSARIYFAFHHLIIDAVSWRIITEDIKNIYQSLEKGEKQAIVSHTKGTSYRQWVNAVKAYKSDDTESRLQELSYWNTAADMVESGNNSLDGFLTQSQHHESLIVSKDITESLIRKTHHVYHTQINDVLLAALALSLSELTGEENHSVILEGHGREQIFDNVDITQTIGWFTTMYPLLLKNGNDLKDTIVLTKETLRSIPNNGIGYGSLMGYSDRELPKISFNYLGQLDQDSDHKSWHITAEDSGVSIGNNNRNSHYISINGAVIDGRLTFEVAGYLSEEKIRFLSERFKTNLENIAEILSSEKRTYLTPSDVEYIVDKEQLTGIQKSEEIDGIYLANSLQEGFVYHALNQGEKDDAYRVQLIWDYLSEIDEAKLKKSWEITQTNYPTLRMRFDWSGEIVQVINKKGNVDWRYEDISDLSEDAQGALVKDVTQNDRFEAYDLSKGDLFRVYLFKRSKNHFTCLFSNHHAILDGWSMPVILNSIHNNYLSLVKGEEISLVPDIAYINTQKYLQDHKESARSFWNSYMNLLEDQEDVSGLMKESQRQIDLGTYRHIQDHRSQKLMINGDRYQLLKDFTKTNGLTINAVLQYLWHQQLRTYSGLNTTIVGTTVSGRNLPIDGIESSAGLYINTLPLIVTHQEGKVVEHIREVQNRISDLNTHSDINLAELHHDGRRVFSSLFVYENYPVPKSSNDNELAFVFRHSVEKLDYPLGIVAYERGNEISLTLNYEGHLFENEMINQVVEGMEFILDQLLDNQNITSEHLSLLTTEKYKKIAENQNTTWNEIFPNHTIHGLFEDQVLKTPDQIAVTYQDIHLSYKELNEQASRLANHLLETYGIQPDDLIPLCLERSEQIIIAILAILKAGAAYVPIDPSYPIERIKHVLEDTNPKVVLHQESTQEIIVAVTSGQAETISLDNRSFKAILSEASANNPVTAATQENLAYVIYTSGTTGLPKGVMIEHKGAINLMQDLYPRYGLNRTDVILQFANYVFDASVEQILLALLNGNKLVLIENQKIVNEEDFVNTLSENKVSYIHLTPSVLQSIDITQVKSLRILNSGGEALPADLHHKLKNGSFKLINSYGPTETTVTSIVNTNIEVNTIGRPISNTSVYVLDNHHRPVPVGAIGELYIGGTGVARGYLNRPELTTERFLENPFQTEDQKEKGENGRIYKTGDLVRYLTSGDLEYIGRNDFQVKIRGYRIELGEIENRMQKFPEVRQVAVLAKENKSGLKYLAGYYVSDSSIDSGQLTSFLSETLAEYMIPSVFVHLTSLPLTINGKLDRKSLPEPTFTGSTNYIAPENDLQKALSEVYAGILGLDSASIGIHDDFFTLGGNSIMAIKLMSRIKKILDIRVEVAAIFSHKTIASLSQILTDEFHTGEDTIISPVKVNFPEDQRLSFAQERLWFLETYEGGSNAYNIPITLVLEEKIDISALYQAFEKVIKRHEVLRSMIKITEDGVGYQLVTDLLPEFKVTEAGTREDLEEKIDKSVNKTFRLDEEIPIAVNIFKFNTRHYLSVVIHHIAFDGWSTEVFLRELQMFYEAILNKDQAFELVDLQIQYKDFALWQRDYLTGDRLNKQIDYWKDQLHDFENLDLPTDFRRPSQISYEGENIYFSLNTEAGEQLRALSKELGISLYSVLLSGYYLMLSAYSGQDDIVIGSPIANRHHAGLEDMIGFFVNTLALREKLDPDQNLKDFLLQVSKSVTEAQSHQDLPFEKLVEELGIEQDTSRHPVFQVMFGLQNFGNETLKNDHGKLFYPYEGEIDYQVAKFDLTTMIDDGGDNIHGMFNYAKGIFSKETIHNMIRSYEFLLIQIAEQKDIKLSELSLIPQDQYKKVTEGWNNTHQEYSKDITIHQLFENQVKMTPNQTALVYQGVQLSYFELNERANRLANYLGEKYNLQPDDLAPLCLDRSENILIAILAVLKSGAAYVPMDPSYPTDRMKHILKDTNARFVIGNQSAIEQLKDIDVEVLSLEDINLKAELEIISSQNPDIQINSQNLAYVIYTSGTTGLPKGVMIEHSGVINLIGSMINAHRLQEYNEVGCYSNYVFDAFVYEAFPALCNGNTLWLYSNEIRTSVNELNQYIKENNIEVSFIPPVLLREVVEGGTSLKLIFAGGEAFPALNKTVHDIIFVNEYGPTEATVCSTLHHYKENDNPLNIGAPIVNTNVYVLDNQFRLAPAGAIGELYIGGAGIARGYLNRPELTEERFISNPFQTAFQKAKGENGRLYKTGDLVRWLSNGELEYVGRNDFQVKIRGHRIELGEIENTLLSYPDVRQVAVLVKENNAGLNYLAGYYVSDKEIEPALLSEHLSVSLPEYMLLGAFVHLTTLPLTINGKLDRRALPEPDFTGNKEYSAPETELQEKLCQIYAEVLGVNAESISIHDDFFRLGGNSIMAIKLISKIRQALDLQIEVAKIFNHKTIALLSHILEDQVNDSEQIIIAPVAIQSQEEQRLSFAQERLWFIENYEGGTSAYNIPMIFRLDEKTDITVLCKALDAIVIRHEVLRSVIRTTDEGKGWQYVVDDIPAIHQHEVRTMSELEEKVSEVANKIFRLEQELPIDINIFKLDDIFYLSVVIHHIAFDGWSSDVFLKELVTIYHAIKENKPHGVPVLKIQYKDFALWQRNYLSGERLDQQIGYWKNKLSAFQNLDLASDFKRPAQISYEGENIYFDLDADQTRKLKNLSKDLGVSLYSILLSGYYLMLSAYSGQDDIIVGSPIANRHHAGLEDMIGFFVNTLALREHINPDQRVKDFILQVAQSVTEVQSYQDLPFEKLVEELGVEKDTSRHPVFQVMFGLQSFGEEMLPSENETTLLHPFNGNVEYQVAKFDLTTMINDIGHTLQGMFNFAKTVFAKETVQNMLNSYLFLLEQIAETDQQDDRTLSGLTLIPQAQYHEVSRLWSSGVKYADHKTIHELFEAQVETTPDHTAVVYQDIRLSYRELNERSNRLANYLVKTYTIQPDDLIPLCFERSEEMLVGILAVLKSGGAYVPMDPSYPADRIKHILKDTGAKIILTDAVSKDSVVEACEESISMIVLNSPELATILEKQSAENPVTQVNSSHLAYVIYTSGTTGMPKGVMQEHRNVARLFSATDHWYHFNEGDVWSLFHSYVFDFSVWEIWGALFYGGKLLIPSYEQTKDTNLFFSLCLQEGLTVLNQTPTAFYQFIDTALQREEQLTTLRYVIFGGEALNLASLKPWYVRYQFSPDLINMYGITETTVHVTYKKLSVKDLDKASLIGENIPDQGMYILDKHLRAVPVGAVGELYVGGAGIARGYLNRAELTAERFISNPFQTLEEKKENKNGILYKTGDLVRYLADGELEYIGRNDFQVKIRGYRIELGEIENRLQEYSEVKQGVVLAKENKVGMKYLVGYYVSENLIDTNQLAIFLSETLPEYMVPAVFVHLTQLPLTINGKLDRRALPEPEFTGSKEYTAPENELQEKLCQIYGEVLGLDASGIGIHEDFFRLGGDSIISIQLVSRIRQRLDIRVSVKDIFTSKSVSKLSELIENKAKEEQTQILTEQGQLTGSLSFLPVQEWFFNLVEEGFVGNLNHWNQSFIIKVPELNPELLRHSVQLLIEKHDAFRIYYPKENQVYTQQYGTETIPEINDLNISGMASEAISAVLTEWQSHFDIENGPLFQIGYISGYEDGSSGIFFALHHLIIDAVSWRIITEDLKNIYQTLENGGKIEAYTKGSSYRQWVEAVKGYLNENQEVKANEIAYWNKTADTVTQNNNILTELSSADYHFANLTLEEKYTEKLIREVHHVYHTQINDLLLSALASALSDLTGISGHTVLLEGHGREEVFNNLDITETVGWFTSMYPVLLEKGKDIKDTVILTKESLRNIPNNGIGYGSLVGYTERALPKISFNYLGQLDQEESTGEKTWYISGENTGNSMGDQNLDSHIISINGAIADGQLRFGISGYLSQDQINLLTEKFKEYIKSTVDELAAEQRSWLTPSDTEHIVGKDQLMHIQKSGVVEGVYLANSLQEGFIYHALNQGDTDDAYRVQVIWDYLSEMDLDQLKKAWIYTQDQLPTLRLRFDWSKEIVQIIDQKGILDWRYHDISEMSEVDKEDFITEMTQKDRFEVYDLSKGSLFRIYLFKRSEKHYTCIFSNHHAILDGWSMPVFLTLIHESYLKLIKNQELSPAPDTAYAEAQKYLQKNKDSNKSFWKNYLGLLEDREDLSGLLKESQKHIDLSEYKQIVDHRSTKMSITGEQYQVLKKFTAKYGFTINAVLQYLWHKQLGIYSGGVTTVVGTTVSGRSIPVDGIESSVGLYINTLPLIVTHTDGKVVDMISEIQHRISELNTHSSVNLASLQHDGHRIFSSLFVYENYPVPEADEESELSFAFKGSVERLDYPLGIVAYESGDEVILNINYEGHLFDDKTIRQLIAGMNTVLEQILENTEISSDQLTYLTNEEYHEVSRLWSSGVKYADHKTIHELFEAQVETTPDHTAVVYQDIRLSYLELNERSNRLANYLVKTYTIQPDDLIPLCFERSEEMLVGILAVLKSGGA
ncbi:hypothetical protein C1637_02115, partial [Chryseobacterium lactis]